jgi:hypothetical protein
MIEAGQAKDEPRKPKKPAQRWTAGREDMFFIELATTANVTRSAAKAGFCKQAVHVRRARDPEFAARWQRALAIGYEELEMLLLRQSLEGSERTEVVCDGDGAVTQTKTVRDFDRRTALRLLQGHRESIERMRSMEALRDGGDPQLVVRIRAELAQVRGRLIEGRAVETGGDTDD